MHHETLQVDFLASVPIGHRVRITTYIHPPEQIGFLDRLFSEDSEHTLTTVEDLETGICYSPARLWATAGSHRYAPEHAPGFVATGARTARVVTCRVLCRRGNAGNHRIYTLLELQPGG